MGILFWVIFFGIIGALWGLVKKAWSSGETLKAVAWLVLTIIVLMVLGAFRQVTMEQKREEWRREFQKQSGSDKNGSDYNNSILCNRIIFVSSECKQQSNLAFKK